MKGISRKLNSLEKNVLDENVCEEDCYLDIRSLPEPERELHTKASSIAQSFNGEALPSQSEREVVKKSCKLLTFRGFLLFRKMVRCMYHLESSVYSELFDMRLNWFIQETAELSLQDADLRELELDNADLNEEDLEEKRVELENTFRCLWTEKSFEIYEKEQMLKFLDFVYDKEKQEDESFETFWNRKVKTQGS